MRIFKDVPHLPQRARVLAGVVGGLDLRLELVARPHHALLETLQLGRQRSVALAQQGRGVLQALVLRRRGRLERPGPAAPGRVQGDLRHGLAQVARGVRLGEVVLQDVQLLLQLLDYPRLLASEARAIPE